MPTPRTTRPARLVALVVAVAAAAVLVGGAGTAGAQTAPTVPTVPGVDRAVSDRVVRLYLGVLARWPDEGGLRTWVTALQRGTSLPRVATALLGSEEYRSRFGAPDDATFVTALYANVLGRAPDPEGFAAWTGALARGTSRGAVAAAVTDSAEAVAVTGTVPPGGAPAPPPEVAPPAPPADDPGLPAGSGRGRRVVYSISAQRVWAVEADGTVVKTHLVSGRLGKPALGTYRVYSRSPVVYSGGLRWEHMVRFVRPKPGFKAIGFHQIPTRNGVPIQTEAQLGTPRSAGCVRQSAADAAWMWSWATLGTTVVVVP